jgi:hypothetical protein
MHLVASFHVTGSVSDKKTFLSPYSVNDMSWEMSDILWCSIYENTKKY